MKTSKKELYEAPAITEVEEKHEGIICASEFKGGNSIDNWGDGGTTDDDLHL